LIYAKQLKLSNGFSKIFDLFFLRSIIEPMQKKPLSTSIDQETHDRLTLLAKTDERSMAEIVSMCVRAGLPLVEASVLRHVKIALVTAPDGDALIHYDQFRPFSMRAAAAQLSTMETDTAFAADRPAASPATPPKSAPLREPVVTYPGGKKKARFAVVET
jgi:hypothetical protein